jgi:hypothetical protein
MSDSAEKILDVAWFDSTITPRCLGIGIRLPFLVPINMRIDVDIDSERLIRSRYRDMPIDYEWLHVPTTIRLCWNADLGDDPTDVRAQHATMRGLARETGTAAPPALLRVASPRAASVVSVYVPIVAAAPTIQEVRNGVQLGPLDLAMWAIDDLVRATRLRGHPLPDLTVESLPAQNLALTYADVVNTALRWTGNWWTYPLQGPDADASYRGAPIPASEQQAVVMDFAGLRVEVPAAVAMDLLYRAHVSLDAGQPDNAIVGYAVACEYFISNLALAIRWENGEDAIAASAALDLVHNGPLALLRKCDPLGGGSWDNDKAGAIQAYKQAVLTRRNKIVHRGQRYTTANANETRLAAGTLIEMLKSRLVRSPKFPRTTSLFTGRESIEAYASRRRRQELLDSLHNETGYRSSDTAFRIWRDDFYSHTDGAEL